METRIKKHLCALMLITSLTVPVHAIYSDISELSPALLKKIEMIAVRAADTHVKRVVQPRKWITTGRLLKVGIPVAVVGVGGYYAGKYLYNKFERFKNFVDRGITFVRDRMSASRGWTGRRFNDVYIRLDGVCIRLDEVENNQVDILNGQEQIQQNVGANGTRIGELSQENLTQHQRTQAGLETISENMATKQDISGMQRAVDRLQAGYNTLQAMVSSFDNTVRHFFTNK